MLLGFIKVGWANTTSAHPALVGNVFSVYIFRQFYLKFPAISRMPPRWTAPAIGASLADRLPAGPGADDRHGGDRLHLDWNNFLWPLLVTFEESMKTMPVGIAASPGGRHPDQLEGYSVSMAG